jgi:hypothetical protein
MAVLFSDLRHKMFHTLLSEVLLWNTKPTTSFFGAVFAICLSFPTKTMDNGFSAFFWKFRGSPEQWIFSR